MLEQLIPSMKGEEDMVLVLAGDIIAQIPVWVNSVLDIYTPWLVDLCQRHMHVIYVMGNHEPYGSTMGTVTRYLQKHIGSQHSVMESRCKNFTILDNETIVVEDVTFIGGTKWTPIKPTNVGFALSAMSDYTEIGSDSPLLSFTPLLVSSLYDEFSKFLEYELRHTAGKVVVVTHHAPSLESIDSEYLEKDYNDLYASKEDHLMLEYNPDVWIHGHLHTSCDYHVMDYEGGMYTRVVCNPRGYTGHHLNDNYQPCGFVEV
jgi:hypothetical protein